MSYRVCIPVAGTGSRLGELTRFVNKSLVSIANRPVLSHLIEQFPSDAEFVIALGHKGHLVQEFLGLAYPKRVFHFVHVEPFEGEGSGLGLTLLACEAYLQQPFVFTSCDTLVREPIPPPAQDWMAYAQGITDLAPYRTVALSQECVNAIAEKGEGDSKHHRAYIGLAGIYHHTQFWDAMRQRSSAVIATGEAHGLRALLKGKVRAHAFTWHDTGNPISLQKARLAYQEPSSPHILEKANEAIWFVDDEVIKFSDDVTFISNRVKRAQDLAGFVPQVTGASAHMYRYHKVRGQVMSEVANMPLFERLLEKAQIFWDTAQRAPADSTAFRNTCMRFYRDKTIERVQLFYKTCARTDATEPINGVAVPTLRALFERLDWDWLADGLPGRFHGDFHFENILWEQNTETLTFLDWRQDFGGALGVGDVYYDLAKLLHGLIVSHALIEAQHFVIEWDAEAIRYDLHRTQMLVECERRFALWLEARGYERKKVWVLTALVYLNIAALHHHPYSLLLYALGKKMLNEELGA